MTTSALVVWALVMKMTNFLEVESGYQESRGKIYKQALVNEMSCLWCLVTVVHYLTLSVK